MKNFLIVLLAAACVVLALRGCGRQTDTVTVRTDTVTLVRIDTVRYTDVVYRDRWRNRTDTIAHVEKGDTIRVPVPIDRYNAKSEECQTLKLENQSLKFRLCNKRGCEGREPQTGF